MAATTTTPKTKRLKDDYSTCITVLVGPAEESFMVHEGIIIHHSGFFRAACSGNFKESKDRLIRLPEADPKIFQTMLTWIYTKEVVTLGPDGIDAAEAISGRKRYALLAHLYVLADQLSIRELRNAVIDKILKLCPTIKKLFSTESIGIAYQGTPEQSTLRKLVRDCYQAGVDDGWLREERQNLPSDFLFDLALSAAMTFRRPIHPCSMRRCVYHEHDQGEPRCI